MMTTTQIIRGVDDEGADRYLWEHERETGVVDVIPQLGKLKWGGSRCPCKVLVLVGCLECSVSTVSFFFLLDFVMLFFTSLFNLLFHAFLDLLRDAGPWCGQHTQMANLG